MSSTHCQGEWQRIREPAHARCARRLRRWPVRVSIGSTVVLQLPATTAEPPSIALIHTAGPEPFGGCWLRRPDEAGQTGGFAGAGAEMAAESTRHQLTVVGFGRDSLLQVLSVGAHGRTITPLRLSHLHLARLLSSPSILQDRQTGPTP